MGIEYSVGSIRSVHTAAAVAAAAILRPDIPKDIRIRSDNEKKGGPDECLGAPVDVCDADGYGVAGAGCGVVYGTTVVITGFGATGSTTGISTGIGVDIGIGMARS